MSPHGKIAELNISTEIKMSPDVEVPVLNQDMINPKATPTAAREISEGFPGSVRIGTIGYTSVFTVSDVGAQEILRTVPGSKIIDPKKV